MSVNTDAGKCVQGTDGGDFVIGNKGRDVRVCKEKKALHRHVFWFPQALRARHPSAQYRAQDCPWQS